MNKALQEVAEKTVKRGVFVHVENDTVVVVRCLDDHAQRVRVVPSHDDTVLAAVIAEEIVALRTAGSA